MYRDLIFDFFGTLVQYRAGSFHSAPYERTHQFLLESGFPIDYEAFVAAYSHSADLLESEARASLGEYHMLDVAQHFFLQRFQLRPNQAVLEGFVSHFISEWERGIRYYDQIAPFLSDLHGRYRLSVLSNTHYPPMISKHLAAMGIRQLFSELVTSVEYGVRKPHPSIFQHTLERLGSSANQALYIGDTLLDDYEGAHSAGMACVLIDPDGRYPQITTRVESLFQLTQLLSD
jgi:HAD superfamily hydrolase (TIGR01509 family)